MAARSLSVLNLHSLSMTILLSSYSLYPKNLQKSMGHEYYYFEPIVSKNLSLSKMSPLTHLYSSKRLLLSVLIREQTF